LFVSDINKKVIYSAFKWAIIVVAVVD
jgi:hypothetical protein